jgi:uncharacterized lipoprotein NlpE involved in copper resistance
MKKIIVVGFLASVFVLTGCNNGTTSTANVDDFAKCITAAGTKMYGTETCPHCQAQKALFGESFQYITFIDCMKTPNACQGIDRVPTWEFADGAKEVGEKTFAELATKTKCELPK